MTYALPDKKGVATPQTASAAGGSAVPGSIDTIPVLPETWPDRLRLWRPRDLGRFLAKVLMRRTSKVVLPADLPLNVPLPKYLLLEFHNLPNGNYSNRITHGYSTGFDKVMLGEMQRGRAALAQSLHGCVSALDIGCGAGYSTEALRVAGIDKVVGIDASPYLLKHASNNFTDLEFRQGLAEQTTLPADSIDGISACYVFHEIPPKHADRALREFRRILRPGGRLSLLEPAPEQMQQGPFSLWRRYGWRGAYFGLLARFVNEPFVRAWHRRDLRAWLHAHGFELCTDRTLFPSRLITARRVDELPAN